MSRATPANPTYFQGDLRRALLDAAAEAIAEQGLAEVSLREVARRVGVSHAAPAHHFGDKSGLFTALATEGFGLLAAAVDEAVESGSGRAGEAAQRLLDAGNAYLRIAVEHPAHYAVMFRPDLLRSDDADLAVAAGRAFAGLVAAVTDLQDTGWAAGADPLDLAVGAWGLVHGLATLHAAGALPGRPGTKRMEAALRAFLSASGATGGDPD